MRSIALAPVRLVAVMVAICAPAQALSFEANGQGGFTGGLTQAETLPAGVVPLLLSAIQRDAPAAYQVTRQESADPEPDLGPSGCRSQRRHVVGLWRNGL